MFIAKQLKEHNIVGYLLYMWQVEDLLRANGLDMERVRKTLVEPRRLDKAHEEELAAWYEELIEMMHREGIAEKGHLQINKNRLMELADLHFRLLHSSKAPFYGAAYYKVLPYIVELRAKSGAEAVSDLETCLNALYGVMLLRLGKKKVTAGTEKAVGAISRFLSLLADCYGKEQRGEEDY